jgi:uncharacterized protein YlaI
MRVKCVICDKVETINDETLQAKQLRNRPIHTYMCEPCHERIAENTIKRLATGNFRIYKTPKTENDEW